MNLIVDETITQKVVYREGRNISQSERCNLRKDMFLELAKEIEKIGQL
jgi:hypothetical protein